MITAGGKECRLSSISLCQFKSQHVAIESDRGLKISDLKMNVANSNLRIDSELKKELLEQMAERRGDSHTGEEWEEAEEEKANGIVSKALRRLGWRERDLQKRLKWDRRQVALAMPLRPRTAMPLKWVAQRLNMGTWTNLSNLLSQERHKGAKP